MDSDGVVLQNRHAWDREAELANPATVPVTAEAIESTRSRGLQLSITARRQLPQSWLGDVRRQRVLALALGGGQQVPLLAAAGAIVTSLENSPVQLESDLRVAREHGLHVTGMLGDIQDLSAFTPGSFDLAIVGLGLQFVPHPARTWVGLAKIVKAGGVVVAALMNPVQYALDWRRYEQGEFVLRHPLPYSDLHSLSQDERAELFKADEPIEFGHTLEELLGGLLRAGFVLTDLLEDGSADDPLTRIMQTHLAVRACRQGRRP